MANAGQLVVTLTADQAAFVNGMDKASSTVEQFSQKTAATGQHVEKFNSHILTSRAVVGSFAGAVGTSSSELTHLLHGFLEGGPIIGVAVLAMIAFKTALDFSNEAAKAHAKAIEEANRKQKEFGDSIKRTNELLFGSKGDNKSIKEFEEEIKETEKKLGELDAKRREMDSSGRPYDDTGKLKFSRADAEQETRYRELIAADKKVVERLQKGEKLPGDFKGGESIQHTTAVSATNLGVFKVEHDAAQITLLQQIAANTAKIGGTTPQNPASNFAPPSGAI